MFYFRPHLGGAISFSLWQDEVVSSYSVAFSPDGQRVFAGCLKGLRIFDVSRPGRECRTLSTYGARSYGSGERGVVLKGVD